MTQDDIYQKKMTQIDDFRFDDKVARVFQDMIQRSVPGYGMLLQAITLIAERYVPKDGTIYDLGCSLGAVAFAIRDYFGNQRQRSCRIIAVDNSTAMLQACHQQLDRTAPGPCSIEFKLLDIQQLPIHQASLVILNFTLQFIDPLQRHAMIERIYRGLLPGGALVLSEKIAATDNRSGDTWTDLHHRFKKAQGYSELEIAQKRSALEKVLIPESLPVHQQRLHAVGFAHVTPILQYFNFVSMLAVK